MYLKHIKCTTMTTIIIICYCQYNTLAQELCWDLRSSCYILVVKFRYGKTYLKAAKSCIEKGADYAKKEIERLQRMLEKVKKKRNLCFL